MGIGAARPAVRRRQVVGSCWARLERSPSKCIDCLLVATRLCAGSQLFKRACGFAGRPLALCGVRLQPLHRFHPSPWVVAFFPVTVRLLARRVCCARHCFYFSHRYISCAEWGFQCRLTCQSREHAPARFACLRMPLISNVNAHGIFYRLAATKSKKG